MFKRIVMFFVFIVVTFYAVEIRGFAVETSDNASEGRKPLEKKVKYVKSKDGVKALMAFARTRGNMVKELNDETENYENIDKAITEGVLEKGKSALSIEKKYGKPVIALTEDKGKQKEWIYKKSKDSYFTGPKIYLFFDEQEKLVSWEKTAVRNMPSE
ncbi:MAG: hypothetical protein ABIH09_03330 [Candidatus Omnitrophota bacterium]